MLVPAPLSPTAGWHDLSLALARFPLAVGSCGGACGGACGGDSGGDSGDGCGDGGGGVNIAGRGGNCSTRNRPCCLIIAPALAGNDPGGGGGEAAAAAASCAAGIDPVAMVAGVKVGAGDSVLLLPELFTVVVAASMAIGDGSGCLDI